MQHIVKFVKEELGWGLGSIIAVIVFSPFFLIAFIVSLFASNPTVRERGENLNVIHNNKTA